MVRTLATAAMLLLAVAPARAQAPSGEISGVVVDASGSPVPGVRITLINQATNATREVNTNAEGIYVLPVIPPGTYSLKAELSGFRSAERRDIELQVGSANRIPITLEVGDVSEVVQVAGRAPLLQTETASIGTVIDSRTIVALPLNGRNSRS